MGRAGCLSQLGVPELAELFSFVWVTAATATAAPSGKAAPETAAAVERAVVSAQRHVCAAVKKRDGVQAAALRRAVGGDVGADQDSSNAVQAAGRVLREATKVLHRGVSEITSSTRGAIPAPLAAVQLWNYDQGTASQEDLILSLAGIPTAVDMLASEIQVRAHACSQFAFGIPCC